MIITYNLLETIEAPSQMKLYCMELFCYFINATAFNFG